MTDDRLFDPGPPAKKKLQRRIADQLVSKGGYPIWEITAGLNKEYVRALDAEHARQRWSDRHPSISTEGLRVKRMYHSDIVKLAAVDPRVAGRLKNL